MQPFESVAVAVIGKLPVCVGVPTRLPSVASVMPVGSVEAVVNVTVPTSPVCVNVNAEYSVPLVPAGIDDGPRVITWQAITNVYVAPAPWQPLPSVAVTVIGKEPFCVGVPERTPVEVLSVIPAGRAPLSDQVIVPMPPDCVKVWLKTAFTVPLVVAGFVTEIVWQPMTRVYVELVPVHPLLSVTVTTIGNEPACVGVPDRTPDVERERPQAASKRS